MRLEATVVDGLMSFDDPTLAQLLDRWLEHITGLGCAETTLYHYRQYVDREIGPELGSIRLSKLSALEIDRLYTKLRKRGLRPATVRQIHAILRASLNQAERRGLVQRNVAMDRPRRRGRHPCACNGATRWYQAPADRPTTTRSDRTITLDPVTLRSLEAAWDAETESMSGRSQCRCCIRGASET